MRRGAVTLVLTVSALLMSVVPPAAGRQNPGPATGTVRGRVLLSNGRPGRRAVVRMGLVAAPLPMTTTADLAGRFEFSKLAPGDYRISAGKPGYLALAYGQRTLYASGTIVSIHAGETLENIDITLPASGAISGRVADGNGDAVESATVRLLQPIFAANRRQLVPVPGVGDRRTDDEGRYRLYGVPPGQYVVEVLPPTAALPPGYAYAYYPGTSSAASARAVTLGVAQEIEGADIGLIRTGTARLSGTATDSSGNPIGGQATLLLSPSQRSGAGAVAESIAGRSVNGRFEIQNVPPGEWVLQIDLRRGLDAVEFASRRLVVSGTDITDLRLQTSPGTHVDGHLVLEGTPAPSPTSFGVSTVLSDFDFAPAMVESLLSGPPSGQLLNAGVSTIRPDGTFALYGVSGPRRFQLVRAPPPWSLKAVRINGREVTDDPISFGGSETSLNDVEIVVTNRAASVSGTVSNAGRTVADYAVLVFRTDATSWYAGSRYLAFARPKTDGSFTVSGLPAAEYYVAAVDWMQGTTTAGEWQDPEFLQVLEAGATRVLLSEGQAATVSPRLIVR